MKDEHDERRQHKRLLFTVEDGVVGVISDPHGNEQEITANVLNLSEGGVYLTFRSILGNQIKEGDQLLLTEIKGSNSSQVVLNVDTEVKWISEDELSKEIGVGCEFLNILKDNKQELNEFVDFWYLQRLQN
jgi:c-di-GMP-binding flagellar brake protein YcgR